VYIPLVSLLLLAPIVVGRHKKGVLQWITKLTLVVACVANVYLIIPRALAAKQLSQQIQLDIHGFPPGPVIIWANSFPLELAYPVLANDLISRKSRFYGLDSFTHAPFSVASTEQAAGRGMLERLRTTGISMIASPQRIEMLRIYCKERLNGQLHENITYQRLNCVDP
jgi:hypothetical protein